MSVKVVAGLLTVPPRKVLDSSTGPLAPGDSLDHGTCGSATSTVGDVSIHPRLAFTPEPNIGYRAP